MTTKRDIWKEERDLVLAVFYNMLYAVTGDGSKKRQTGAKPPWYKDDGHEGAIHSHHCKWKRGETVDKDSGAHPLVHEAWRCLAIAWQEMYGKEAPTQDDMREFLGLVEEVKREQ